MPYNYTPSFEFEHSFDPADSTEWMKENWTHSLTLSTIYIIFIYTGEKVMSHRKPFTLEQPLLYWNSLLAIFSMIGMFRMSPEFFDVLVNEGFQHSICNTNYAYGVTGFWTYTFAVSKGLELIDTVFIVLRKRPIIFLHVYHHITVLVYTWHAYKDHTAAGRWFVWMNYTVHSMMYTYYACRIYGIKFAKWVPMMVTTLQLAQMVVGCCIAIAAYRVKLTNDKCNQTFNNLYFSFFIYSTYFMLFAKFFYKTYIRKGNKYQMQEKRDSRRKEQ